MRNESGFMLVPRRLRCSTRRRKPRGNPTRHIRPPKLPRQVPSWSRTRFGRRCQNWQSCSNRDPASGRQAVPSDKQLGLSPMWQAHNPLPTRSRSSNWARRGNAGSSPHGNFLNSTARASRHSLPPHLIQNLQSSTCPRTSVRPSPPPRLPLRGQIEADDAELTMRSSAATLGILAISLRKASPSPRTPRVMP